LKRQKADLEILLETTTEHSDTMEAQLPSKAHQSQEFKPRAVSGEILGNSRSSIGFSPL